MHIVEGIGDVKGLVRENIPKRKGGDKMAKRAGPGESSYTVYDRDIAARAQVWLHDEAAKWRDRPWALFVSFVSPHFPLTAPPRVVLPVLEAGPADAQALRGRAAAAPSLPRRLRAHGRLRHALRLARPTSSARSPGYAGLVSAMDENIGLVLGALASAGLDADTRVIYTSDHGDNVGARGLWGKSTLYEESAGVPLIVAGRRHPGGQGRRHARVAHRLRADDPRGDRRAVAARRRRAARRVALRRRRRRDARAAGDLRVPRDRLGRRRVHAALRALEVLPLRRVPAAALRPRGRSRGD